MRQFAVALGLSVGLSMVASAPAQSQFIPLSQEMGITQQLGSTVPTDVPFLDEQGKTVTLANYMGKEPVLLVPIFYTCKTGCAMITDSLVQTLLKASQPTGMMGYMEKKKGGDHPLTPGKDMEIVMISIDPRETPALAANKKNEIVNTMDSRGKSMMSKLMSGSSEALADQTNAHLHLLTGTQSNILKVTDAIGFKYYFNPTTDVIRHPTCSVVVTPKGVISSYTIGNDFPTKMLETSLALAADNRVSDHKADQSFMFGCIMLDPATGHLRFVFENIVRGLCALFLLGFSFGIYRMIRNERKAISNGGGLNGFSRSH